jgi:serine/threonine-protein kinase
MADRFTGEVLADKYRLETLIAADDVSGLYSGVNIRLERPVLVKVLPAELAEDEIICTQFFDRARLQSHITGPNVLTVSDFGTAGDGSGYVVFEGSADGTLANAMRVRGKMPWMEAVDIARQIATALAAGHMANATHGNLTPAKILLTVAPGGTPDTKVFDFGSTNPLTSGELNGQSISDVLYLAPEQCSGSEVADSRSDIYALGVILYEMLAGEPPFTGEKPTDVMLKQIEEPPAPLSAFRQDLPPAIEPIVLKALTKDSELRYQTAAEMEQELYGVLHGRETAAAAGNNNLWKTAFIVLAGIALLSAFLIYATSSKQTNPATALQPDANGLPVQPINPATGAEEQSLALMPGALPETMSNANVDLPPGVMPGGDGYNPWANGTTPPAGAPPTYVGPGGQIYTIDPNTGSPFMAPEGGVILVPVPANTNTNTGVKPAPSPKAPANANTATTPEPDTAPKPTPAPAKPTPAPSKAPAQKPPANKPAGDAAAEPELEN